METGFFFTDLWMTLSSVTSLPESVSSCVWRWLSVVHDGICGVCRPLQPRAVNVDLQTDATLQVDISDALSERDKVKFTVHTKVSVFTCEITWWRRVHVQNQQEEKTVSVTVSRRPHRCRKMCLSVSFNPENESMRRFSFHQQTEDADSLMLGTRDRWWVSTSQPTTEEVRCWTWN